jgi:transcriptional regulator with XRE-family HTH domain
MSINQRIKEIRKDIGLNQSDFGARIGLKSGAISKIEQDGNTVVEQNKRIICDKFHVSMHWLETGEGDKYTADAVSDIFDSMRDELNLSDVEENILRKYFELSKESRQAVTDFIISIGNDVQPPAADPPLSQSDRDRAHAQLDQELDAAEQDASASHSTARKKA